MAGLLEAFLAETTRVSIEGVTGLDFGRMILDKSMMFDVLVFDERDDELALLDLLMLSLCAFPNCGSIK